MPVRSLHELIEDPALREVGLRLARGRPGLILGTGQSSSGKITALAALALEIAGGGGSVALVTDKPDVVTPFAPLPTNWQVVIGHPSTAPADAKVVIVTSVTRENAAAVFALPEGRWVLAALDTALVGLDTAYALYEMGIENATFVERVRAVWSQFLVAKLCRECAQPAELPAEEAAYLFPAGAPRGEIFREVGCPVCDRRGTKDREAICDVLVIDESSRAEVRNAMLTDTAVELPRESHLTAKDWAQELLAHKLIGIGTFRNAIRRNPLLRAQNLLEREQSRSSRLDVASRHKSEFLANMSHELRTPLNAIIGFSDVILGGMAGPVPDNQREFIGDIRESGRHLLALINDILDLSKIEAGRMELHVTAFDLPAAVQAALTLVQGRAQRQGVRLQTTIGPGVGECEADERKFKQILLNLLSNAVKFTPEGGTVSLAVTRAGGIYEVAVRDTGIGIAAEDLDKVFEEFRQVGTDVARKAEGTGLGLSLTRRLVELHGGSIRATSVPGEGSVFTFTLPVRTLPPPVRGKASETADTQ